MNAASAREGVAIDLAHIDGRSGRLIGQRQVPSAVEVIDAARHIVSRWNAVLRPFQCNRHAGGEIANREGPILAVVVEVRLRVHRESAPTILEERPDYVSGHWDRRFFAIVKVDTVGSHVIDAYIVISIVAFIRAVHRIDRNAKCKLLRIDRLDLFHLRRELGRKGLHRSILRIDDVRVDGRVAALNVDQITDPAIDEVVLTVAAGDRAIEFIAFLLRPCPIFRCQIGEVGGGIDGIPIDANVIGIADDPPAVARAALRIVDRIAEVAVGIGRTVDIPEGSIEPRLEIVAAPALETGRQLVDAVVLIPAVDIRYRVIDIERRDVIPELDKRIVRLGHHRNRDQAPSLRGLRQNLNMRRNERRFEVRIRIEVKVEVVIPNRIGVGRIDERERLALTRSDEAGRRLDEHPARKNARRRFQNVDAWNRIVHHPKATLVVHIQTGKPADTRMRSRYGVDDLAGARIDLFDQAGRATHRIPDRPTTLVEGDAGTARCIERGDDLTRNVPRWSLYLVD